MQKEQKEYDASELILPGELETKVVEKGPPGPPSIPNPKGFEGRAGKDIHNSWLTDPKGGRIFGKEIANRTRQYAEDAVPGIMGAGAATAAGIAGAPAAAIALTGATIAGGTEASLQLVQHILRNPDAPKSSKEAALRIYKQATFGLAGSAAPVAKAVLPAAAASKAIIASQGLPKASASTKGLVETRAANVNTIRAELRKLGTADEAEKFRSTITSSNIKEGASLGRRIASQEAERSLGVVKEKIESATKKRIGTIASKDPELTKTNLIGRTRVEKDELRKFYQAQTKEAYKPFDDVSDKVAFVSTRLREHAKELDKYTVESYPALKEIIDAPDIITAKTAENYLSLMKELTNLNKRGLGRTRAEGLAAEMTKELQPLIKTALKDQPKALASLEKGRAMAKLTHDLFDRGPGMSNINKVVGKAIDNGVNPATIAKRPEALESYLAQTHPGNAQRVGTVVFDSSVKTAINPSTQEFSRQKFAIELAKYPKAVRDKIFTPEQNRIMDSLAKGDKQVFDRLKELTKKHKESLTDQERSALFQNERTKANALRANQIKRGELREELAGQIQKVPKDKTVNRKNALLAAGGALGGYYAANRMGYPAYRALRELLRIGE